MKIPYVNLAAQYNEERAFLLPIIDSVLASGIWIGGELVEELEAAVCSSLNVKHAVALNSGTDALIVGLRAAGIGPGDEVITAPNSFVATAAAVVAVGAKPIFVDVGYDELINADAIESAINPRTAAIIPVHLRGSVCDMEKINHIAKRNNLLVIEDSAQSYGSKRSNIHCGTYGDVGCFSLHPLKGLNACGDGGLLVTNSDEISRFARLYRNHGLIDRDSVVQWGTVSRLDAIQAAIVIARLKNIENTFFRRRVNAKIYHQALRSLGLRMTMQKENESHTYNTFVIQHPNRDVLQKFLLESEIATAVHYKIAIHEQPVCAELGYKKGDLPVVEELNRTALSIPVHQSHSRSDIEYVASKIIEFGI